MASPYDVAIHLSLVSNVAEGLAMIVSRLAAADIGVTKLQKGLAALKPAVLGAVGAFAGFEMIKGVKALADHAKDLSHELTQIQNLGISPTQFEQAKAAASSMPGQVPGTTTVEALKTYGQIYSPLGHDNSIKMLKSLSEFVQVVGNTTGNYKAAEDKVYNMVRAGDLMGKFMNSMTHQIDIEKLQHFLDLGARVIQATHGRVGADQWFMLAQQGGPALSNMSDQGLLTMAMITQAMGGGRAGTALSSLFTQFQGGIMTKWRAQKLMELGILDKNAVEEVTPGGHIIWTKGHEPGTSAFAKAMADDPLKAIGILKSAMETNGYPTIEKQVPLLFELFQRQTSIREIHDLLRNMPQLLQERERIKAGLGISASFNLKNSQDYEQNLHRVAAAWDEMIARIGLPITVAAIPVMHRISEAFLKLGTLATLHPEAIEHIATGITVLGAALMGGGGLAMLSALGPAGWLAAGIIAAGAAMALYRNPISTWLENIRTTDWNKVISDSLMPIVSAMKQWFLDLPGMVMDAMKGMWDNMKGELKKLISYTGDGGDIGGGGLIKTSYGGGGTTTSGGFGRSTGGGGAMGNIPIGDPGSNPILQAIHRSAAGNSAIERVMKNIYASESGHGRHWDLGDQGAAGGPFQLNTAGGRMGAQFQRSHPGMSVHDPRTLQAQADYVAAWLRSHPHSDPSKVWFGLQHPGRFGHLTGGYNSGSSHLPSPDDHPAHLPPPAKGKGMEVHNYIYLDGKVIANNTSKHLVRAAQYPTSVGRQDGRGTFMGPGAEVFA